MNQKLIDLCDRPWIQERRPRNKYVKCVEIGENFIEEKHYYLDSAEKIKLWLPVGWNPETGNWQIDDLLMEAKGWPFEELRIHFDVWTTSSVGKHGLNYYEENDLILKLTWLNELVEEGE